LPGTGISRITLRERAYDLVPVADEKQNGRTEGRPFCNNPSEIGAWLFPDGQNDACLRWHAVVAGGESDFSVRNCGRHNHIELIGSGRYQRR